MNDDYNAERIMHFENESRKILNKEFPLIQAVFKPYLNKQVVKQDGQLLKKIKDLIIFQEHNVLPFKQQTAKARIWLSTDSYSIHITLSLCITNDKGENYGCSYYEKHKYICEIKGFDLVRFYDEKAEDVVLIDITEQLKELAKAQEIKAQYEAQKDKLFYGLKKLL